MRAVVLFRYIDHMLPDPYHMISGGNVWAAPWKTQISQIVKKKQNVKKSLKKADGETKTVLETKV